MLNIYLFDLFIMFFDFTNYILIMETLSFFNYQFFQNSFLKIVSSAQHIPDMIRNNTLIETLDQIQLSYD